MSQYNHLVKYPYLLQFCQENQIPIEPYTHTYDQLILRDIVANPLPHFFKRDYESRRTVINNCLQLGYNNGIMDADRVSRLKGSDSVLFWSCVCELKVGVWIEGQGIQILSFEPPSATGGKGDYLIQGSDSEIFVEVKTIFGESYTLEQERLTGEIAQYCKEQSLPAKSVDLLFYPRDYDCASVKDNLLINIGRLIKQNLPLTDETTITYKESNGLEIEIDLSPNVQAVHSMTYGGISGLQEELKTKLDVCVIGKRKLQTSANDIPSICIIDDLSYSIDDIIIESVLYGNLIGDHTKPPNVVHYRESDGKWSGSSPSELSSVFILRFVPNSATVETLNAYLCPNPKFRLSQLSFPEPKIVWRELDEEGVFIKTSNFSSA